MRSLSIALLCCMPTIAWADEPTEPMPTIAWADEPTEPTPSPPTEPEKPAPVSSTPTPAAAPAVERTADLPTTTTLDQKVTPFAPWLAARLYIELELYSQARMTSRDGEDLSELRLDRGEFGGRIRLGKQAYAELRFEAIRSAIEGGSLGIDGDSTVFRTRTAQLVGMHELGKQTVRLEGALGFVPDPWIRTLEDDYTVKPLSRTGSERLLLWPATDLAALVRATAGPVRATVSVGNGEGVQFPERNTCKTTTAIVEVAPIATDQLRLTIAGVVRDGSIGVASIRDRRYGGGVSAVTPRVRAGAEAVFAQGICDIAAAEGLMLGAWADAKVVDRVFVAARGSSLGFSDDGGRMSTFGGAIAYEPWRESPNQRARGRFRIWLAVDRVTSSGNAMPLPGADAGDATQLMLIASAIARSPWSSHAPRSLPRPRRLQQRR